MTIHIEVLNQIDSDFKKNVSMRHGSPRGDCKVRIWELLKLPNTKRKRKRSDSVLWQKPYTNRNVKGQSDNTTNATKKFD